MSETEHGHSVVLPLAAAAARLGISPDALRMRIRRGRVRGFKRGGRLFVAFAEDPNASVRSATEQSEQPGPDRFASAATGAEARPDAGAGGPPAQALPVIVEFQKLELDRLLRDNTRLNHRLDQLIDELVHLREMQQREQVLRQQDQALRQQIQTTLDRLSARLALAGPPDERLPPTAPAPGTPSHEPAFAERPDPRDAALGAAAQVPEPGNEAGGTAAGPVAPGPEGPPRAGSQATASGGAGAPEAEASGVPATPAGSAYAYGPGARPATMPEERRAGAAELAGILKEIGDSLREFEPVPPASPEAAPGANAESAGQAAAAPDSAWRAEAGEPPLGPAPPAPAGVSERRHPAEAAARPDDDEARLLEILGRMGPSAEDRRSAARIMKRLLRGRGASRPRDPES